MTQNPSKVAILGAGAIAYATAAILCRDGHNVTLWSPSGRRTEKIATGEPLIAKGALVGQFHPRIATSCAEALAGVDAAVIAVPGYAHRHVLDAAAPHLRREQVVIFSSHISLSALYLDKLLRQRGVVLPICALGTTLATGRQPDLNSVTIGSIRARVDLAIVPEQETARGLRVCRSFFGDRFVLRPNILAVSLSNINPETHLAMVLCNLTRMEVGETWGQWKHVTPAVSRLLEELDAERLAIAKSFGLTVRTIHEHFHFSYNAPMGPLSEMLKPLQQETKDVKGPTTLDARYVTEDVPFGLVPIVRLAELAGVAAPLHENGVRLLSALYSRHFVEENDILPELGTLSVPMLVGESARDSRL
jgi:opine dehydrogenase